MTATRTGLDRLLAPRSIALVGASADPLKFGGRPLAALRRHGYDGELLVVNPGRDEIGGVPCVPSPAELPEGIDLAVILLPADAVLGAVRACIARDVGAVAVFSGGFRETGPAGAARERELARVAREGGVRLLGPNCPGFVNLRAGTACSASAYATRERMVSGPIGFVLGSGAVAGILCDRAFDRGIGVGSAICTGNAADVDVPDVVRHLAADGGTRAIGLFLEGVGEGTALMEALRDARGRDVGIAVLKVGRTGAGRSVVASHTAALVGSDDAFDAMCASLGVVRVDDYDDLLETTNLLARAPRPGRRLAVAGASGGMNAAIADAAESNGLALPPLAAGTVARLGEVVPDFGAAMNPVDISSAVMADPGGLGRSLAVLASDPGVDGVVVVIGDHPPALAERLADGIAAVADGLDGNVVAQWSAGSLSAPGITGLNRAGIPVFESPERCMRAIARVMRAAGASWDEGAKAAVAAPDEPLSESAAKGLLEGLGVPAPRRVVCADPADVPAALAAAGLEGTLAVKADCVGAVHKADVGAVRLGVAAADAGRVAGEVVRAARAALGDGRVRGALVEEMVAPVAELMVAVHRDPNVGPVVTVGAGGALVELMDDTVSRLAPVDEREAARMLDGLRIAPLLDGHRGRPPADRAALAAAVAAVSRLGPRAGLVEINPLAALPRGACALDAVVEAG
ncbi:MAG TPA: acetate--CoA ligase family protein [Miltoncostaeaceae bacterium]|nr:acetate--CoA ligase family protein [Miltoncostaeaceae bacterium]